MRASDLLVVNQPASPASGRGWREYASSLTSIADWSHSGIAVLHDGRMVVSTPGHAHLSMITPHDDSVVTVACGAGIYHGMATDPDTAASTVWLADIGTTSDSGALLVYTVDTGALADASPDPREFAEVVGWRPTALAVERGVSDPRGPVLWVADGYGHSLVHRVEDGRLTLTINGASSGRIFDCPHGIALDTRAEQTLVVVADRGNQRLVWFTLDGEFVRELQHDLIMSPSSIVVYDDRLIVTELFGGIIAVLLDDTVIDLVARSPRDRHGAWPNDGDASAPQRPALNPGQINSPHGIARASHGVVVTEWLIGGRTIHLSHELVSAVPAPLLPESETKEDTHEDHDRR